jgi:hypothetical protein
LWLPQLGTDQEAVVARKLGWWTTVAGIDHPVEDYTRVTFACGLGQVTWNRETQHHDIGQIDAAAIVRAMNCSA